MLSPLLIVLGSLAAGLAVGALFVVGPGWPPKRRAFSAWWTAGAWCIAVGSAADPNASWWALPTMLGLCMLPTVVTSPLIHGVRQRLAMLAFLVTLMIVGGEREAASPQSRRREARELAARVAQAQRDSALLAAVTTPGLTAWARRSADQAVHARFAEAAPPHGHGLVVEAILDTVVRTMRRTAPRDANASSALRELRDAVADLRAPWTTSQSARRDSILATLERRLALADSMADARARRQAAEDARIAALWRAPFSDRAVLSNVRRKCRVTEGGAWALGQAAARASGGTVGPSEALRALDDLIPDDAPSRADCTAEAILAAIRRR